MPPIKLSAGVLVVLLVSLTACNTDPRVACRRYVDSGNKYFLRGKYKEASILYRRAISKDAKYADAWYQLGLTNTKLALFGEARKDFVRAMDLDPANTDTIAKLGDLDLLFYAADQRGNKALLADLRDLAQRLLKRDKRSFDGLRFAGEIALIEKDWKTGIQRFQEANQARPDQPELVLSLAQTLLADHQDEAAERLARETIERVKAAGAIYDFLYTNYLRTNRLEQAEELLKTKIDNNPSEGAYVMQLAYHYYMTGRTAEMDSTIGRLTAKPSAFPEARLQVGNFYARTHEYDKAIAQFELGEKESPKSKRIYQKKMVEVWGAQGQPELASNLLDELLREDSKDPESIALDATLRLSKGGKREAQRVIAELTPLVTRLPGNAVLHYNLGQAYVATGDPSNLDQARTRFQEALKIDTKYIPARLSLAELELRRGESAIAGQQAEKVLNVEPTNLRARLVRARAWMNMSEYAKARDELTAVLRASPQANPLRNDARFEMGQLDLRERRYGAAEDNFQALLDAGDARGLAGAIESRAQQGHGEQAIRLLEDLEKSAPERSDYRVANAQVLFRAGRFAQSAAQFESLLNQNPNSAELYLRLGECKARLGDYPAAVAAFLKARERSPNDAAADLALAIAYDQSRMFGDARKSYEEALRKQPDNPVALNNLANLDLEQGLNLDQALAYAQRARAKLPDDPNVMDTLGLIYVRKNLVDDGLRMLRESVSRKPDSATFHLHLALALCQTGDRRSARKELESAKRYKPTEQEQAKIKELLAKVG